jgi:hypothetical protein
LELSLINMALASRYSLPQILCLGLQQAWHRDLIKKRLKAGLKSGASSITATLLQP